MITRSLFVSSVLFMAFVVSTAAQTPLDRQLSDIAARVDGVVGYSVLDLTSGERFGRFDKDVFPTASTIKIAIVYELFKQVDEAKVRLDDTLQLDRSKAVGGTGVLYYLGTPTMSIRDYATLMVMLSDNTATNVLIDRLGMAGITRRMEALGLPGTKLRRHMMDVAAARRGDDNVSTPEEIVRLLQAMNASEPDAIALLKKPKDSRLRKGLPRGVETADKPGELDGVRVDAGIVFAKDRPYILCVMMKSLRSEAEGERAIEEMSRAAYAHFSALRKDLLP